MSKPCGRFSLRVDWLTICATSAGGRLIPATSASSTSTLPVPSALEKRPRSSTGTVPLRNASRPAPAPGGIFDFTRSRSSIPRATTRSFWRPSSRAERAGGIFEARERFTQELSCRSVTTIVWREAGLPALSRRSTRATVSATQSASAQLKPAGAGGRTGSPLSAGAAWARSSATRPSGRSVTPRS